jgi:hypothetical protein
MRLIAHRGNIDGPKPLEENRPEYIEEAIKQGFDVEIDIRYDRFDDRIYLGHDEPQYYVPMTWLVKRKDKLWIHCKDFKSLDIFSNIPIDFNFFWHENDKYTLTSKGYIWTYPGQLFGNNSVIVMPEVFDLQNIQDNDTIVYSKKSFAVCSDYVEKFK